MIKLDNLRVWFKSFEDVSKDEYEYMRKACQREIRTLTGDILEAWEEKNPKKAYRETSKYYLERQEFALWELWRRMQWLIETGKGKSKEEVEEIVERYVLEYTKRKFQGMMEKLEIVN